jgi:hypothetical protein
MPIGIVAFDLGLPLYVLEDVFSDLEPILVSLQTQGEAIDAGSVNSLGATIVSSVGGYCHGVGS